LGSSTARMKEYPGARVALPPAAVDVEEATGVLELPGPLGVIVELLAVELLDGGAVP